MPQTHASITWRDGALPISKEFDDPYYSIDDGLAESEYVFLQGTRLPDRFQDGFVIAELGFGTGLNFMAALRAWEEANIGGSLYFVSFEAFPLQSGDLERAHSAFSTTKTYSQMLCDAWPALLQTGRAWIGSACLQIHFGDARQCLPRWEGAADAWFLDGFSPAKNPQLWEPALLQSVFDHTRAGGYAATYSAAGAVKRALASAGFDVYRQAGFGHKRHMSYAIRNSKRDVQAE